MTLTTRFTFIKIVKYFFLLFLLTSSTVFANNIEKKFATNQEYLNNELGISTELKNKILKFQVENFKPILVERMNIKAPENDPSIANLEILTYIMPIELFKHEFSLIALSFALFPKLDKLTVQFYGYDFKTNAKSNLPLLSFELTQEFFSQLKDPTYMEFFSGNPNIRNIDDANKILNVIANLHLKINKAQYAAFASKHKDNKSLIWINQAIEIKQIELMN